MNRHNDSLSRFPAAFLLVAFMCVAPVALHTGCSTFYHSVVSLTQVVDGASKEYARLYNDGLIPPELAFKVSAAHLRYREAARLTRDALIAYKTSGDPAAYEQAFALAGQAASEFVQLLLPLLYPDDSIALQTGLKLAIAGRKL